MQPVYLAETIRAAEQPLLEAQPGLLMQRAAAGLAAVILAELRKRGRRGAYGARVLLVVGSGNNGGDALYAGVRLLNRGVRVRAWRTGSSVHHEAWTAFRAAGGGEVDAVGALVELATTDLVVDGVLGIGGRPGLREPVALFARACADAGVPVIAVDLPSGLEADGCGSELPASAGMTGGAGPEFPASAGMTEGSGNETEGGGRGADSRRGWVWPPREPATEAGCLESAPLPPPTPDAQVSTSSTSGAVSTSSTSGETCLTGASHFTAELTVTFGGLKPCHVLQPAASACGRVQLIDIGLDLPEPDLMQWEVVDVAAVWPFPDATSDKYSRGVVGLDIGSDDYPGAAVLGTLGAVHAGAGMVRFLGAQGAADLVRAAAPNVVVGSGRVQARVLGSGWGDRADGAMVVENALREKLPLVLDADALRFLPAGPLGEQVLLTPHAGELARLLGVDRKAVTADPISAVRRAAERFGATVLLKGATQYVCGTNGEIRLAVAGPAWTGQAGSGDVLAGVCGALLAAGLAAGDAALAAASLQALAASSHPGPWPPHTVATRISSVVEEFSQKCATC